LFKLEENDDDDDDDDEATLGICKKRFLACVW